MKKRNIFLLFLFLMVVFLSAASEIRSTDIWFNLKSGLVMADRGEILKKDIFSFTRYGAEWNNRLWLFQFLLGVVFKKFSWTGLVILRALSFTVLFFILLCRYIEKETFPVIIAVAFLALLCIMPRILLRPELVTFLFLACIFYIVEKFLYENKNFLYFIPLIFVLWVNMHGLYVLGFIVLFFALLDTFASDVKKARFVAVIIAVSVLALFVNPFGINGVTVPFKQYAMLSKDSIFSNIAELMPLVRAVKSLKTLIAVTTVSVLAVIAAFLLVCGFIERKKIDIFHVLIFAAFFYLAVKANRNIALFSVILVPVIAHNIESIEEKIRKGLNFTVFLIAFVLLFSGGYLLAKDINMFSEFYKNGKEKYIFSKLIYSPAQPADFVFSENRGWKIYSDKLLFNNYYLWKFGPKRKVFCDGRLEIYGGDFFKEMLNSIKNKKSFYAYINKYGFNALVFSYIRPYYSDNEGKIYQRLADIYFDAEWEIVYLDKFFIVFLNKPEFPDVRGMNVEKEVERLLCDGIDLAGMVALAKVAYAFKEYGVLEKIAFLCNEKYSGNVEAALINAEANIIRGNLSEAKNILLEAYENNGRDVRLLKHLSNLAFKEADYKRAMEYVKEAVRVGKNDIGANMMAADCAYKLGLMKEAEEYLRKVKDLDPGNETAEVNLKILESMRK